MPNPDTALVIERFNKVKDGRWNFESQWQEIRLLVRPTTKDFLRTVYPGDRRTEQIFDGTAPWALEQLAASLDSNMTDPSERWFNIGLSDENRDLSDEELMWCETVSDRIYKEYGKPEVNLAPMLHEIYQDLGAFGTAVLYQDWDWRNKHIHFRAFPLADCFILEGGHGRINAMWRRIIMSVRQVKEEFSRAGDVIPPKLLQLDDLKEVTVINEVRPTEEGTGIWKSRPGKMKYDSTYVILEFADDAPVREEGYDQFPYHVPRWSKLAGEQYGRSPGMICLPDIKMLNVIVKTVIRAAQKIIDPPLIVPDDGFMLPLKTSPGSLIFKTAGQEDTIEPLKTGGNIQLGNELIESRRDQILKGFYVDWIIRNKKKERQTTTEIQDDRMEMLKQMAPMLGRTMVELTSPMIVRTYDLLSKAGQIPPAPQSMHHERLGIYYSSPAAEAQKSAKAQNISVFSQDMANVAKFMPDVIDSIDPNEYAQEMAKYRGVTRKILRTKDQALQLQQQRQKAAAQAQAAATAKDGATAAQQLSQVPGNLQPQQ